MMYYGPPLTIEPSADAGHLTRRIRNLIGTVALDCDCRQRVNDALQRFVTQEQQRHDRQCLMQARQHRASIAALVDLLGELEDVSWQEGDRSVFAELAHIFDDIARMAAQGSAAMQMISRETAP